MQRNLFKVTAKAHWSKKKVAEVSGLRSTKSNTNYISTLLVAAETGDLRYG